MKRLLILCAAVIALVAGNTYAAVDSLRLIPLGDAGAGSRTISDSNFICVLDTALVDFIVDSIVFIANNHDNGNDTIAGAIYGDATNSPESRLANGTANVIVNVGSGAALTRFAIPLASYTLTTGTVCWVCLFNVNTTDGQTVRISHNGNTPETNRIGLSGTAYGAAPSTLTGESMSNGVNYHRIMVYGHTDGGGGGGGSGPRVLIRNH